MQQDGILASACHGQVIVHGPWSMVRPMEARGFANNPMGPSRIAFLHQAYYCTYTSTYYLPVVTTRGPLLSAVAAYQGSASSSVRPSFPPRPPAS